MDEEAEHLHTAMHAALIEVMLAAGGRVDHRPGYDLVLLPSVPIPELNAVYVLRPEDDELAAAGLEDAIAETESLGLPSGVAVCPGWSPRVQAEARRLGLTVEESNAGMVARRSELAHVSVDGLEVVRVVGKDLEVAQRVAEAGFETPPGLLAPFYSPQVAAMLGVRIYVGFADGVPVSTATGFAFDSLAGVYSVGTPPEHRRRGYGAALSERAARDGFAEGARLAGLKASALGEPVYRRLGFRTVRDYVILSRQAGDEERAAPPQAGRAGRLRRS